MDGNFWRSEFFKGRIIEFLFCLPIWLIVSFVLVRMCFCSIKPLIDSYMEVKEEENNKYERLELELSNCLN